MTSEWPIRSDRRSDAPRSACAENAPAVSENRLHDAAFDLTMPAGHRLSDRVRAAASTMLEAVTYDIERDLRLSLLPRLPEKAELQASLSASSVAIALPLLFDAGLLRHPPLIALVVRRAEAFFLAQRIAATSEGRRNALIDDDDPAIAAAAMELLLAESRALDRFNEPALLFDDLPAEVVHWLVWQVSAALRHYLSAEQGMAGGAADAMITEAAGALLAAHDEERGLSAVAAKLAARLGAAGRIDGALLGPLLEGGEVSAFVAALANGGGISGEEAWDIVAEPVHGRLALLLRAAGVTRDEAGELLLHLREDPDAIAAEIDAFDLLDEADVRRAMPSANQSREYRSALARLDFHRASTAS